jgi:hypothetical protein
MTYCQSKLRTATKNRPELSEIKRHLSAFVWFASELLVGHSLRAKLTDRIILDNSPTLLAYDFSSAIWLLRFRNVGL